jgi:MFS family permease
VLLEQAEYTKIQIAGLSGGVNTVGILGTIISAQIIDRLGRRACLMGGSAVLFAVNLIVRLNLETPMKFAVLTICRPARYMKHRTTIQRMSRHMHLPRSQCSSCLI